MSDSECDCSELLSHPLPYPRTIAKSCMLYILSGRYIYCIGRRKWFQKARCCDAFPDAHLDRLKGPCALHFHAPS